MLIMNTFAVNCWKAEKRPFLYRPTYRGRCEPHQIAATVIGRIWTRRGRLLSFDSCNRNRFQFFARKWLLPKRAFIYLSIYLVSFVSFTANWATSQSAEPTCHATALRSLTCFGLRGGGGAIHLTCSISLSLSLSLNLHTLLLSLSLSRHARCVVSDNDSSPIAKRERERRKVCR